MLPSYFDYIFVHQRPRARLRPELSTKLLSTLDPNPARTRPEKSGPTYNSVAVFFRLMRKRKQRKIFGTLQLCFLCK